MEKKDEWETKKWERFAKINLNVNMKIQGCDSGSNQLHCGNSCMYWNDVESTCSSSSSVQHNQCNTY